MFLSVVILGRFTTETHAMARYISADTPPLHTPHPGTLPISQRRKANRSGESGSCAMDWRAAEPFILVPESAERKTPERVTETFSRRAPGLLPESTYTTIAPPALC